MRKIVEVVALRATQTFLLGSLASIMFWPPAVVWLAAAFLVSFIAYNVVRDRHPMDMLR